MRTPEAIVIEVYKGMVEEARLTGKDLTFDAATAVRVVAAGANSVSGTKEAISKEDQAALIRKLTGKKALGPGMSIYQGREGKWKQDRGVFVIPDAQYERFDRAVGLPPTSNRPSRENQMLSPNLENYANDLLLGETAP